MWRVGNGRVESKIRNKYSQLYKRIFSWSRRQRCPSFTTKTSCRAAVYVTLSTMYTVSGETLHYMHNDKWLKQKLRAAVLSVDPVPYCRPVCVLCQKSLFETNKKGNVLEKIRFPCQITFRLTYIKQSAVQNIQLSALCYECCRRLRNSPFGCDTNPFRVTCSKQAFRNSLHYSFPPPPNRPDGSCRREGIVCTEEGWVAFCAHHTASHITV
jgi:hypothetical protein